MCFNRNRRGIKLLEVIVAAGILVVSSLFLLTILPSSQWAAKKAQIRMTAENLALSEIEILRGGAFANLEVGTIRVYDVSRNDIEFSLSTEVAEVTGKDPAVIKKVETTVTWSESSTQKSISLEAFISRLRR